MGSREKDHSIHGEPHVKGSSFSVDPSEGPASRKLSGEKAASDPNEERAKHSIFDEPAVLPNRLPTLIEDNWICRNCGYNLRGLMTGHRCPECGKIEAYEPPRQGEASYAQWSALRQAGESGTRSLLTACLIVAIGLPLGFVCSILKVASQLIVVFVLIGPAVVEVTKIAGCLLLVETKKGRIRTPGYLYAIALGSAFTFAVGQNLGWTFANAPIELIAWRWTGAVVLHGLCTYVATRGIVAVWRASNVDGRLPRVGRAFSAVATAIAIHAAFNACVLVRRAAEYGF